MQLLPKLAACPPCPVQTLKNCASAVPVYVQTPLVYCILETPSLSGDPLLLRSKTISFL